MWAHYWTWNFFVPKREDVASIFIVAALLTFLRLKTQAYFIEYATREHVAKKKKFSESSWKSIIYLIMWIWGLILVYHCDWFPETKNCWKGFPNFEMSYWFWLYYIYQLAFYWHTLYAHLVIEVKRSDYWALLVHHVVTIWLIYFSYTMRFERIGLLVLVCHDTNDVFFEFGKTLLYMPKVPERYPNVLFGGIMISWIVTRLGLFPMYVIYSAMVESIHYTPPEIQGYYWAFNGCLLFLLCLNIYWFGLMIRMAVAKLKGNALEDIREVKDKSKQQQARQKDGALMPQKSTKTN